MPLDFGSVTRYFPRGYGFVSRSLSGHTDDVFFHIATIRRKAPHLADALDQDTYETISFWYDTESGRRGEQVREIWLDDNEIPSRLREDLTTARERSGKGSPAGIASTTSSMSASRQALVGPQVLDGFGHEFAREYQRAQQAAQATQARTTKSASDRSTILPAAQPPSRTKLSGTTTAQKSPPEPTATQSNKKNTQNQQAVAEPAKPAASEVKQSPPQRKRIATTEPATLQPRSKESATLRPKTNAPEPAWLPQYTPDAEDVPELLTSADAEMMLGWEDYVATVQRAEASPARKSQHAKPRSQTATPGSPVASGYWYHQFRADSTSAQRAAPAEPRQIETKIVGVTYEGRQSVVKLVQKGERLWLRRQPDNTYDPNAICVERESGAVIGFLGRGEAAQWAAAFDKQGTPVPATVSAVVGDTSTGSALGVRIRFTPPEPVARASVLPDFQDDWENPT